MPIDRKRASGIVGALGIAAALITSFEGTRHHAYPDQIGVTTICVGHTHGVKPGDTATQIQCDKYLVDDLAESYATVKNHLTHPQPDTRVAALVDFTYNVGAGTFIRSSVLRKINAGDIRGGCDALKKYVFAGGRRLPGLVRRRIAERELCLKGL